MTTKISKKILLTIIVSLVVPLYTLHLLVRGRYPNVFKISVDSSSDDFADPRGDGTLKEEHRPPQKAVVPLTTDRNQIPKAPQRAKPLCQAGTPCVYESEVDLRVIVLTHDRKDSLLKLLDSLQRLELDGNSAALEIWVDPKADGTVHGPTLEAAESFRWTRGTARVHVQSSHVGIMGQWIDTWRPRGAPAFANDPGRVERSEFKEGTYREMALILEDDLSVSPLAYRWLKAAHRRYNGRADYAGVTLQSDEVLAHNTGQPLRGPKNESAFMYVCIGTWGFAPAPKLWAEFQDWFHRIRSSPDSASYRPFVKGAKPSEWYEYFLSMGTQDGMWEMWFIHFADSKKAFTVFNNLPIFNEDKSSCLSINRREVGLHYKSKGPENLCNLLEQWNPRYSESLPAEPIKFGWSGEVILK